MNGILNPSLNTPKLSYKYLNKLEAMKFSLNKKNKLKKVTPDKANPILFRLRIDNKNPKLNI